MTTSTTRSNLTVPQVALIVCFVGSALILGCTTDSSRENAPRPKPQAQPTKPQVRADILSIQKALDEFAANNGGTYPDSLDMIVMQDANGQRYLNVAQIPLHPWGREYRYVPGRPSKVMSFGADGKPGGEGDDADLDAASLAKGR